MGSIPITRSICALHADARSRCSRQWLIVQRHSDAHDASPVCDRIRFGIRHSKLTAQGQISVPAEVRKRLGVGPGSVLEWDEQNDQVIVRRAGRSTPEQVHRMLFPNAPAGRQPVNLKDGIRRYMRSKRHARD